LEVEKIIYLLNTFMEIEIKTVEDDNFKIVKDKKPVEEKIENTPQKEKKPAPLHNNKGIGWFDGTSWGTK